MKTKVRITGTEDARKSALAFIKKTVNGDELLKEVGQFAADQIRNSTRGRQEEYAQADLKQSTIENRDRLIRAGNAYDKKIVRNKRTSNLSMSGQLLDSIKYKILKSSAEIIIFLEKARRPYKGIRKPELENIKDNVQIKNELESKGRKFLFISQKLSIQLENRIKRILRTQLSIYNKLIRK